MMTALSRASRRSPSVPSLDVGRWAQAALGQELFGRPAGPWGALLAPVPIGGWVLLLLRQALLASGAAPWLIDRLGEVSWLLIVPFVLAAVGQGLGRLVAEGCWTASRGEQLLDASPRAWHYHLALALTALPLVLLQVWPPFLDAYLTLSLKLHALGGPLEAGHIGYDPNLANLGVLLVAGLVYAQVHRLMDAIPNGRLVGLQRELARLRGAVQWEPEAWEALVADAFDRRFADLAPAPSEAPPAGERRRRQRVRWGALRKEVVAAFCQQPPDLARANRALTHFRQG